MTGSQKVGGSNPPSSTREAKEANQDTQYLSIRSNSCTQLAVPLDRLVEGFLLSCKVENKSPATISLYPLIKNKFQWFIGKFGIETGIIKVIGKGNKERLVRIGLKTQKVMT